MNKTAIITGASKGIGKAIAEEFGRLGYNLALISRDYKEVKKVADNIITGGFYIPIECDVSKKEEVKEAFEMIYEETGSIDVLVNNAGINSRRTINPYDTKDWDENFQKDLLGWDLEIATNLTGTYLCSLLASKYMLKQDSGSIINISSIKGKEPTSSPGYGASKAGIIKLTKDFAKSLAPSGIRVNCIAPGFIDTGMTAELSDDKKNHYFSQIPLKRFGNVFEIAKVVAFLSSNDSSYITGTTINVDGGYLMS